MAQNRLEAPRRGQSTGEASEANAAPVSFRVPGRVPSKSNYRKGGKHWREQWRRIKAYQKDVGWLATRAGAKSLYGYALKIEVVLRSQILDPDNSTKVLIDSLKGVCLPDDSHKWIRGFGVRWDVGYDGEPEVLVTLIPVEEE